MTSRALRKLCPIARRRTPNRRTSCGIPPISSAAASMRTHSRRTRFSVFRTTPFPQSRYSRRRRYVREAAPRHATTPEADQEQLATEAQSAEMAAEGDTSELAGEAPSEADETEPLTEREPESEPASAAGAVEFSALANLCGGRLFRKSGAGRERIAVRPGFARRRPSTRAHHSRILRHPRIDSATVHQ